MWGEDYLIVVIDIIHWNIFVEIIVAETSYLLPIHLFIPNRHFLSVFTNKSFIFLIA